MSIVMRYSIIWKKIKLYLVRMGGKLIKDNQKLLNRLHVVLDALIIVFSYGVSWLIRFKSGFFELSSWYLSLEQYMKLLIYIVPLY